MEDIVKRSMVGQSFDAIAVSSIDFKSSTFEFIEIEKQKKTQNLFFDLASLTKPLTLSLAKLSYPQLFKNEASYELLLNHRGSLPSGGRLSRDNWQEQLLSYVIKDAPTLYSDYGALRLMLELEKKSGQSLKSLVYKYWADQLLYWRDLPVDALCPATGWRLGGKIKGQVNDDNAFVIASFCSHAGLFATISGLSQTLINLNEKFALLSLMENSKFTHRFVEGWDTAAQVNSLAGEGHGSRTFGHLGFTGTSMWLDPHSFRGHIILTNATQNFWYDRIKLNILRKKLGALLWKWI